MIDVFTEYISKEAISNLPLISFEGAIHIIDDHESCLKAVKELRKHDKIGFDTEAKPTFVKGEYNHTALVQLSTDEDAYLFRLNKLQNLNLLFELLENPTITKFGISIMDDLKDLDKLRPFTPQGFVDLNHIAKEIGIKHIGVRKLTALLLERRVSKGQQVSNWENETLTSGQKKYAATDAWICLILYHTLQQKGYI